MVYHISNEPPRMFMTGKAIKLNVNCVLLPALCCTTLRTRTRSHCQMMAQNRSSCCCKAVQENMMCAGLSASPSQTRQIGMPPNQFQIQRVQLLKPEYVMPSRPTEEKKEELNFKTDKITHNHGFRNISHKQKLHRIYLSLPQCCSEMQSSLLLTQDSDVWWRSWLKSLRPKVAICCLVSMITPDILW